MWIAEVGPFHEIVERLEIRADQHVLVGAGGIGDVGDLAGALVEGGDTPAHAQFTTADADEDLALHDERRGGRGLAEVDIAGLRAPLFLPGLGVQRDDVVVERHQEDLAAVISDSARQHVAAGNPLRRPVLIGNVGPLQIPRNGIESEHFVGERTDDVKGVADDQRRRLLSARRADRKHPGDLELADIGCVDLVERAEAGAGVIASGHHPLFRISAHGGEVIGSHDAASARRNRQRQPDRPQDHAFTPRAVRAIESAERAPASIRDKALPNATTE